MPSTVDFLNGVFKTESEQFEVTRQRWRLSWVSSANLWKPHLCLHITCDTVCVYRVNKTGPSTYPRGTPYSSRAGLDGRPFMTTDWNLSLKYESNHMSAIPHTSKVVSSLRKRIEWSSVSNAADRSSSVSTDTCPPSAWSNRALVTSKTAVSVLWYFRYADWFSPTRLFSFRWVWSCDRIFDRKGNIWYWSVISQDVLIKALLFEKRSHQCLSELM